MIAYEWNVWCEEVLRKCELQMCLLLGSQPHSVALGALITPEAITVPDSILIPPVPTPPRAPVVSCNHPSIQHFPVGHLLTPRLHQLRNELLWLSSEPASPRAFSTWPLPRRAPGQAPGAILDYSIHTPLPVHEEIPLVPLSKCFRDDHFSPPLLAAWVPRAVVCGPDHCSGSCLV